MLTHIRSSIRTNEHGLKFKSLHWFCKPFLNVIAKMHFKGLYVSMNMENGKCRLNSDEKTYDQETENKGKH